ncbi:MAG: hypothetical protein KGI97_04980 [Alphaproteobacteria bacterium]|nr:hypothetical protein [Alphaproteobacteria bacterium]
MAKQGIPRTVKRTALRDMFQNAGAEVDQWEVRWDGRKVTIPDYKEIDIKRVKGMMVILNKPLEALVARRMPTCGN